jgi:hypothetical protein
MTTRERLWLMRVPAGAQRQPHQPHWLPSLLRLYRLHPCAVPLPPRAGTCLGLRICAACSIDLQAEEPLVIRRPNASASSAGSAAEFNLSEEDERERQILDRL